jgi:hypothetical protein
MTYTFDGYNYVIKLMPGDRLIESIEQFAHEAKIEGAWIEGLGAVQQVTLGFYDLGNQQYLWQTFDGLRELASLTGNLAFDQDGKIMLHAHGVLSDREYKTIAGHIKDFVAGATVELFIHRTYKPLQRSLDKDVGLQTLDL